MNGRVVILSSADIWKDDFLTLVTEYQENEDQQRQIRAAIFNASHGKPLKEGDTLARIAGYAAYIHMTDPALGAKLLKQLAAIDGR